MRSWLGRSICPMDSGPVVLTAGGGGAYSPAFMLWARPTLLEILMESLPATIQHAGEKGHGSTRASDKSLGNRGAT